MNNLIIYTDGQTSSIEEIAKKCTDCDVRVKNIEEVKEAEGLNPAVLVLDIPMNKLKDLSMIMKFPVPVLVVCDSVPENITVRAEAFDYIVKICNKSNG